MTRFTARWSCSTMLLRYFTWAFDDQCLASGIDLIHGRLVGVALVHGDLLGNTAGLHGFFKKAQGCSLVAPGPSAGYRTPHEVFFGLEMQPIKLPDDALCI